MKRNAHAYGDWMSILARRLKLPVLHREDSVAGVVRVIRGDDLKVASFPLLIDRKRNNRSTGLMLSQLCDRINWGETADESRRTIKLPRRRARVCHCSRGNRIIRPRCIPLRALAADEKDQGSYRREKTRSHQHNWLTTKLSDRRWKRASVEADAVVKPVTHKLNWVAPVRCSGLVRRHDWRHRYHELLR